MLMRYLLQRVRMDYYYDDFCVRKQCNNNNILFNNILKI